MLYILVSVKERIGAKIYLRLYPQDTAMLLLTRQNTETLSSSDYTVTPIVI